MFQMENKNVYFLNCKHMFVCVYIDMKIVKVLKMYTLILFGFVSYVDLNSD